MNARTSGAVLIAAADAAAFRRWLVMLGCWYLLFVVYGSLVPLDFTPQPLDQAAARFRAIPYLDLGITSRADWVANILLYIPLALLWFGAFSVNITSFSRLAGTALGIFACGAVIGIAIEFVQIFFPPRTVSLNDILAQTLGSLIGVCAWWHARHGLVRIWQTWHGRAHADRMATNAIVLYLAAMFGYGLMPLDLTISLAEIHDKWASGRLVLNPFRIDEGDSIENLYALGVDTLLWMPLTWYLVRKRQLGAVSAVLLTAAAAAALEVAQIIVYSRIADSRDVLMALLGAALAARLAGATTTGDALLQSSARRYRTCLLLLAAWTVIVFAVFWYPFEFDADVRRIAARLRDVPLVPFTAYYFGTEYRAATEMLRKLLMFAPYGMIGAVFTLRPVWVVAAAATAAGTVEAGQLLIAGKVVDPGDVLFALAGAIIAQRVYGSLRVHDAPSAATQPDVETVPRANLSTSWLPPLLLSGGFLVVCMVAAGFAAGSGTLPYNVRETVATTSPALAGLGLGLASLVMVVAGTVSAAWLRSAGHLAELLLLPVAVTAAGAVVWGLLHLSVPREAMHDLVGAPVLNWPWHFELMLRMAALAGFGIVALATAGAVAVDRLQAAVFPGRGAVRALAVFALLLPLFHYVIVFHAATDNLTELMADGGNIGTTVLLAGWLVLLAVTAFAAGTGATRSLQGLAVAAAVVLASTAPAYLLLNIALEDRVFKYGAEFSALQFLLSPSRDALVAGPALMIRYVAAHCAVVVVVAMLGVPLLRALLRQEAPRTATSSRSVASTDSVTPAVVTSQEQPVSAADAPSPEQADDSRSPATVVRLAPAQYEQLQELAAALDCAASGAVTRIIEHMMRDDRGKRWLERERAALRRPQNRSGLHSYRIELSHRHLLYLEQLHAGSGIGTSRILRAALEDFAAEITAS